MYCTYIHTYLRLKTANIVRGTIRYYWTDPYQVAVGYLVASSSATATATATRRYTTVHWAGPVFNE